MIRPKVVVTANKKVRPSILPFAIEPVALVRHLITIDGIGEIRTEAKNMKPKIVIQMSTFPLGSATKNSISEQMTTH